MRREDCDYTSCYCEENIYKLCESISSEERSSYFVVFISNEQRMIPLFQQKAARDGTSYVLWDYHVILIQKSPEGSTVFDLDTLLPFPCNFIDYFSMTIRPDLDLNPIYRRKFRVIPAQLYIDNFSSDRSHMRKDDSTWQSPPPQWECIYKECKGNNIFDFISMCMDVNGLAAISKIYYENTFLHEFCPSTARTTA